ncbi:serine aminopeptidase domain-containing protein, partial [Staphylococcus haemolyticus]|uniref:serine aminopeptidase domain-containing protein n=1 Tax=Staphylococcus haemolyticus TaxID=1283 RepID=UPI00374E3E87
MQDFHPTQTLKHLTQTLNNVTNQIHQLLHSILLLQAQNHQIINPQSPNYIYQNLHSHQKHIKCYPNSPHLITIH